MIPSFKEIYKIIVCVPLTEDTLPNIRLSRLIGKGKCTCTCCGIKATHVASYIETTDRREQLQTNIFAQLPDGTMRMMTVDHILPKVLGGTNFLSNLQPMCTKCNMKKGKNLTQDELDLVVSDPTRHMQLNPRTGRVNKKKWNNLFQVAPNLRPVLETIVSRYA